MAKTPRAPTNMSILFTRRRFFEATRTPAPAALSHGGRFPALVITDSTAPTVPSNVQASSASSSQIDLSWTASTDTQSGLAGYRVYRNGSISPLSSPATNSYADTGLAASTLYSYRVSAYDNQGNESAQSSAASATTLSSGGDPFAEDAYSTYTTYIVDPLSGNDTTGTGSDAAPWRTIQKGVDQLTAGGIRVLLKATATYTSQSVVFPGNSGTTDNNRCVLMNYPGQRPILSGCNFQIAGQDGVGEWTGTYTTIRGLNMQDTNDAIITVFTNYDGLIVEYCDLHAVQTLEIDPQGGGYAGVYFRGSALAAAFVTIRQCWIRDIHAPNSTTTDNLNGIAAYDARNMLIHNCGFLDIQNAGVRIKRANANFPNGPTVRNCLFDGGMDYALKLNISGGGDPRHETTKFYENLVRQCGTAVFMQSAETNTQSTDLEVYQNTFAELCATAVLIQACTAVKIHSCAYLNTGDNYSTMNPNAAGFGWLNTLTQSDRNAYRRKAWSLFTASSYTALPTWSGLTGITEIAGTNGIRDVNSLDISADTIATHFPTYTDGTAAAYRLALASSLKAAGVGGVDIGYDPDDCGPSWSYQ